MSQRFVIGPISIQVLRDLAESIPTIDLIKNKSILVIADTSFYVKNEAYIVKWCNQSLTSWSQKGMILGFVSDEERDLFLMRWA
jgi:hypothetical protein